MKAHATYSIKTCREAVLTVEGPDYFSAGIVFVRPGSDVQAACYAEAERKCAEQGLALDCLRAE